jgi:hypothetical protein
VREDERLPRRLDKVAERVLDRNHKLGVTAREGAEVERPLCEGAVERLLDAERVRETGVTLPHDTLGIALELDALAAGRRGRIGSARRASLQVPARAGLCD